MWKNMTFVIIGIVLANIVLADSDLNFKGNLEEITVKKAISANYSLFLNEQFERFDPASPSNSGHTVIDECGGAFDGSDFQGQLPASAKFMSVQLGGKSYMSIDLYNSRPNTLYTIWIRVKGVDRDGNPFGGSPLTNGGATPLAAGSKLDELEEISPWNSPGSTALVNGFTTNSSGRGKLITKLDFPLIGGSYPFNKISNAALENIRNLQNPSARAIPVAIVNPRDINVNAPFALRIVSHCQDGLGHGLSPANRETWFDWPSQ